MEAVHEPPDDNEFRLQIQSQVRLEFKTPTTSTEQDILRRKLTEHAVRMCRQSNDSLEEIIADTLKAMQR